MAQESIRVGVLGAGSWGTALAQQLAVRGHDVRLWAFEPEVVAGINANHENPIYMTGHRLSERITATGDIEEAVTDAAMILFVIPAQHERTFVREVSGYLPADAPLVICAKGIERESLATMDQVFTEELPGKYHKQIAVLSGPSFAAEVIKGAPTNVTVACRDLAVAKRVQEAVATRSFRAYTTDDVIGVEIGGSLKNVIAIAVGACDGLGFGHNPRAAIITRGLAELTRMALHMGGRPETMLGLAGVGDLILTCTGDLSRNRTTGKLLAQGRLLSQIQEEMKQVAEGVPTAASARSLAQREGVDAPITDQVYRVLYEDITVAEAMGALQARELKEEWQT